jgi:hypothetical protein
MRTPLGPNLSAAIFPELTSESSLIIKDEAAYVSDAMQAALDPMLAVSKGRLIEMSSPNGKRGHFYENWQHGVGVERIKIIGRECPRIGVEFLEKMRQKLGPMLFATKAPGRKRPSASLRYFIRPKTRATLNGAPVIRFAKVGYASLDAFFRRLIATVAGLGSTFLFRPPATSRSNDGWR